MMDFKDAMITVVGTLTENAWEKFWELRDEVGVLNTKATQFRDIQTFRDELNKLLADAMEQDDMVSERLTTCSENFRARMAEAIGALDDADCKRSKAARDMVAEGLMWLADGKTTEQLANRLIDEERQALRMCF